MLGVQLYGMTCPLLTKSDGGKMGKTEAGSVWLDAVRTSPYDFYQYWVNVADEDAGMCLRFLTELPHEEILQLDAARAAAPHLRESQLRLAQALTQLVHGDAGLAIAERAKSIFFGGAEISDFHDTDLTAILADVPSTTLPWSTLDEGLVLVDGLVAAGLAKSKGEARRAIQQGGVYVNNRRLADEHQTLKCEHLASESIIVSAQWQKKVCTSEI